MEGQGSMKTFQEKQVIADRQNGRVREVIVDRTPGAPTGSERILLENFGECYVHSCQPAGRDAFKITVRRA